MENAWLTSLRPNPQSRVRLICFPYAGGSAAIFKAWPTYLPASVEVCPVLLPGRGRRMREMSHTRVATIVTHLAPAIETYSDKPFAFFGHSMGALIGFELARQLRRVGAPEPTHLFASGCPAPQMPASRPLTYSLPEAEFLEKVRSLNGTPPEVLAHPELMQLILPLLRADFEAVGKYKLVPEPPFACHISVYGGLQDTEVSREQLEAWRQHTVSNFVLRMFDGDHFFLHQNEPLLLRVLGRELLQLINA
jgi:medium-chain acyl-[acyl-carrier-protein] hydrolase